MLAEGFPEKAVSVLEEISPSRPYALDYTYSMIFYNVPFLKDILANAYKQKGELDKAIAEYKRLMTFYPKSWHRYLIHPRYHYRLAKSYKEKGWKGMCVEAWRVLFGDNITKPMANYYSCRLKTPNYSEYAYEKCAGKSGGKCIDFVYGIKGKKSELQSLRYPKKAGWTKDAAKSHCKKKGGSFDV